MQKVKVNLVPVDHDVSYEYSVENEVLKLTVDGQEHSHDFSQLTAEEGMVSVPSPYGIIMSAQREEAGQLVLTMQKFLPKPKLEKLPVPVNKAIDLPLSSKPFFFERPPVQEGDDEELHARLVKEYEGRVEAHKKALADFEAEYAEYQKAYAAETEKYKEEVNSYEERSSALQAEYAQALTAWEAEFVQTTVEH
jgi:hypothetical protein